MLTPIRLFILQLFAHISLIYGVYYDIINWYNVLLVYCLTGCVGMTVTYHRLLTHRSFSTSKLFEYIGTIIATIGLTGSSISWTSAHRQHHIKTDKQGDPHSPSIIGYFRAQWMSMFSQFDIRKNPLLKSRFHRFMHKYYIHVNLLYGFILFCLFGFIGVINLWLIPACILWNAGSFVNTVCHTKLFGYRNFDTNDNSVNNPVLGLFMFGEGWHNNHHMNPGDYKIGKKWYEIDIGRIFIDCFKK